MDNKLVETLAKVMIAAGWADKELTSEERDNLKDLLFQFERDLEPDRDLNSGLSARTSAMFEMYTSAPIDSAERDRLIAQLQENVWSEEDRALVLAALQRMVEADGKTTEDERAVLNETT